MVTSPGYHLPSRVMQSPPQRSGSAPSSPSPATGGAPGTPRPEPQALEMSQLYSPSASYRAGGSPNIYHTPMMEPAPSAQSIQSPPRNISSPKPLLLASSHRENLQPYVPVQGNGAQLLPSLMPGGQEDDPFNDAKVPLESPRALKSAFDATPPVSPAASEKQKAPPPLFKPTIKLLFSLSTKKDKLTLLLPALFFSLAAGLIPPIMTFVLGEAFDVFAAYQVAIAEVMLDSDLATANDTLKTDMTMVAVKLVALGVAAVAANTAALSIWLIHGERATMRLRRLVFKGVVTKPMAWFDLGMGKRHSAENEDGDAKEESESSGGLMGRFARETDLVRNALIAEIGRLTTCVCTIVACLVVAFWHSYLLTFVILGSVPLIVIITVVVEVMVTPLIIVERNISAAAAATVERSTGAIATIKAFNAEKTETKSFVALAQRSRLAYNKITMLWGFRAGFVQFLLLTMFITGFWFGNWQVLTGKKTAGDVTIVFWASLLASSNMQMILPMLNLIGKGKIAMASLLETAHHEVLPNPSRPTSAIEGAQSSFSDKGSMHKRDNSASGSLTPPITPNTPTFVAIQPEKSLHRRVTTRKNKPQQVRTLRKIQPAKFSGELSLKDVTFHYPSRPAPAPPALDKVSLFLPARDTTYIVGGSGSGKSTVGSLLLNLYKPDSGTIEADEQGIEWIDEKWLRGHIGMVSQGASVIFEGTVHENVALGVVGSSGDNQRKPEDVTRQEVIDACRAALFHDFVRALPDGYDTMLSGEKGASLSGGQRQRLAIARAYVRDPTVLVLDEATSALDTVSRSLVHEAIKKWRRNRTTIIITHDLSPITSEDFVYVMRDGKVVEQGYRKELETKEEGWFRQLAHIQADGPENVEGNQEQSYYEAMEILNVPEVMVTPPRNAAASAHLMNRLSATPSQLGDHIRDYQQTKRKSQIFLEEQQFRRLSASSPASFKTAAALPVPSTPPRVDSLPSRPQSYFGTPPLRPQSQFMTTPPRPRLVGAPSSDSVRRSYRDSTMSFGALERVGLSASTKRPSPGARRPPGPRDSWHQLQEQVSRIDPDPIAPGRADDSKIDLKEEGPPPVLPLWKIVRIILPEIPNKVGLCVGLLFCVGAGICTPFFSNLFAQLLSGLGNPGAVNLTRTALLLLLVALANGLADWGKYSILQRVAMGWIAMLQERCFNGIINQDKAWFDQPENTPISLVTMIVKDAEDARNLIGYVVGNMVVILSMMIMGIVWAFIQGWQLTLVGLSMGPLFALSAAAGSSILGKYERINKVQREDCAKKFYQSVTNVKAIRSMSLESVFLEKFEASLAVAYQGGKRSAFFTGFGTGIAFFTIYAAQAVMFAVGAIFITRGWYTFQQVMVVFTLLIFTITFSMQIIQNIPQVTKAKYAACDFFRLKALSLETAESEGKMTFPVSGHISFENVSFNYPARPDINVLSNVSFEVKPGECVGIVGPSGSGKSTVAALLQRLYEPTPDGGVVRIDGRPLQRIDVKYLRDHVAVISQHPALFDMSIEDNIRYGSASSASEASQEDGNSYITHEQVVAAAKAAHLHDFIMTLPDGYKTHLGENAGLISGGQAQRLQIARALVRPREILLGDEITSALDAENQDAVMKTILDVKVGRTTLLVTHKMSVMKTCDRLIVVENGRIVQQGHYDQLVAQKGSAFAKLASAGELEHT